MLVKQLLITLSCFFLAGFSALSAADSEISIPLASDDEIIAEVFPAKGDYLILWFAPEYGFREAHRSMASRIGEQNIEVWMSNIQESLFMPNGSRSIKQIDGSPVAEMIAYAHQKTGKKILVAGDSYASVLALRGAYQRQKNRADRDYLVGAILFSPYTYAFIPPIGHPPEYLPVVSSVNFPIMIYQAKHSAIFSQFETLLENLRKNGSPVYTRYTPNVMSLFYEPEPTQHMISEAGPIPGNIRKMLRVLEKQGFPSRPVKLAIDTRAKSGIDTELKPINEKVSPLPINLKDLNGDDFTRDNFKNRVTLINFWATWCPPCIEEIPSLNRLQKKMAGQPFEIISINYAEEKDQIDKFIEQVPIDFPVLLDQDGHFAQQWNIISYPSSYIIDTRGNIVYGVNAAIEWDSDELVSKLKALMSK